MATGGMDATVTLWDMESLVCVRTVSATDSAVHTLSFSHDSKYLAFAGDANNSHTVEVLDIASGETCVREVFFLSPNADHISWIADHISWIADHIRSSPLDVATCGVCFWCQGLRGASLGCVRSVGCKSRGSIAR